MAGTGHHIFHHPPHCSITDNSSSSIVEKLKRQLPPPSKWLILSHETKTKIKTKDKNPETKAPVTATWFQSL